MAFLAGSNFDTVDIVLLVGILIYIIYAIVVYYWYPRTKEETFLSKGLRLRLPESAIQRESVYRPGTIDPLVDKLTRELVQPFLDTGDKEEIPLQILEFERIVVCESNLGVLYYILLWVQRGDLTQKIGMEVLLVPSGSSYLNDIYVWDDETRQMVQQTPRQPRAYFETLAPGRFRRTGNSL